MIRAALRLGSVGTCIIPHTGHSATTNTNVEDLNGFVDYRSIVKLEQVCVSFLVLFIVNKNTSVNTISGSGMWDKSVLTVFASGSFA